MTGGLVCVWLEMLVIYLVTSICFLSVYPLGRTPTRLRYPGGIYPLPYLRVDVTCCISSCFVFSLSLCLLACLRKRNHILHIYTYIYLYIHKKYLEMPSYFL
ncbi:hypothetical protein F4810DRAFT_661669, partial [Camillea tinctor]